MDVRTLGAIDLCAGIGQLGEAVRAGLSHVGFGCRMLAHVERDSAAAAALRLRMEAAELDHALISDDMVSFDGRPFRERVAGVCAGLPCPAFSAAGKRIGNFDYRAWGQGFDPNDMATWGPIPHAIRIIAECGAGFVFFENVPGWIRSGAYEPLGCELHCLGYTRQASIFIAAKDVGAPHGRERCFVLAITEQWRRWVLQQIGGANQRVVARRPGEELANTYDDHRPKCVEASGWWPDLPTLLDHGAPHSDEELANARSSGLQGPERRRALQQQGPAASGSIAECGSELGDPQRDGKQTRSRHAPISDWAEARRGQGTQLSDGELPLYPPPRGTDLAEIATAIGQGSSRAARRSAAAAACRLARGIWRDWETVAHLDPASMPAIESKISMVVDGHPYAAADLLRIGGNCVVTDAATLAFTVLWRDLLHP